MQILSTPRLTIRYLTTDDSAFILELLNDPAFIKNIGDRGVRNLEDAQKYILNGPVTMYEKYGFGLFLVELTEEKLPIGMCGLLKRDSLEDVDIGFAFLPQFTSKGYAFESASAVCEWGRHVHQLKRIAGIVNPDNEGSIRLLEKLGMKYERMILMPGDKEEIKYFAVEFKD